MKTIIHWMLRALVIMIAAHVLPGIRVDSLFISLVVALFLGFLNTFIRPVLIIISLPLQLVTLGLFTIVINAAIILLVSNVVDGFHVRGFWYAVLFSFVVAILNGIFTSLEPNDHEA